jgi:hypothetical protein
MVEVLERCPGMSRRWFLGRSFGICGLGICDFRLASGRGGVRTTEPNEGNEYVSNT